METETGRMLQVRNLTRENLLCSRAVEADSFGRRALGMMFRKAWGEADGFLLAPCGSIHTFGMRMPIDVCFLDADMNILKTVSSLRPWRLAHGGSKAQKTLELPAGALNRASAKPGDRLHIEAMGSSEIVS